MNKIIHYIGLDVHKNSIAVTRTAIPVSNRESDAVLILGSLNIQH